jgi:hypothetical protein
MKRVNPRPDQPEQPEPDDNEVLATLSDDAEQSAPDHPARSGIEAPSRRAGTGQGGADARQDPESTPAGEAPDAEADEEPLTLPDGAWIALRRSGGLLFRSDDLVIYPDGRVVTSGVGGGRRVRAPRTRRLSAAELEAFRDAVQRANLRRRRARARRPRVSPDAFVTEIVIEDRGTTRAFEVPPGRVPIGLAPLIEQLLRISAAAR